MESVVEICRKVLKRLSEMDYERIGGSSMERLIFPVKIQANGTKEKDRISEQELRQLFIEEFKIMHKDLYYSIETPTKNKYSFSNEKNEKKVGDIDNKGQSALVDMCVFDKVKETYKRTFNIEFKHKNATHDNISKDILKLMHEEENGAFVLLLKNTDDGTFKSVFKKFSSSFDTHLFKECWSKNDSFIEIIILSLEEKRSRNGVPFLIHRKIKCIDILKDIFSFDGSLSIIEQLKKNGWDVEPVEVKDINKID